MKSQLHPFAILAALAVSPCGVRAAGVAILKEQAFHRDSMARVVVYSQIFDSRGPYLRLISGGANVDILRSNLIARIEMPDGIPASIMEETDIAPLREMLADVRKFTARYPRSVPVLKQQTGALANYINRFDAGDVRFEGVWVSRNEFVKIQDSRKRETEANELTEVEKRVFEASQRDKGMVLHDGKWMTKRTAEQSSPNSLTELSDSIEPLWNGDLDAAKFAVKNLADLALQQTGAPKVRTERLMATVRNLFLAEARLTQRIIARAADTKEAAIHDENAKKWLIPNAFGNISQEAARESHDKAQQIRRHSLDEIATCKRELLEQLQQMDIVAGDFEKLREHRVVLILGAAARAVAGRHFTEVEYNRSIPDSSVAADHSP